MSKNMVVITSFLLAAVAAPAFAHDAEYAKECSKEGAKISNVHKRDAFLKSCLKRIDMTAFQFSEKAEQCDQNAKNMKLNGKKKDEYLKHCYLEDDTHPNTKQTPHPKM